MPQLKVDSITNRSNNASTTLTQGATIPSGKTISGAGGMTVSGTLTGTFSGNGSSITGLSFISQGKALAIKIITDSVLPFRS